MFKVFVMSFNSLDFCIKLEVLTIGDKDKILGLFNRPKEVWVKGRIL